MFSRFSVSPSKRLSCRSTNRATTPDSETSTELQRAEELQLHSAASRKFQIPGAQPGAIGKYQIIRQLGTGGQSETFHAFDPDLGRPVAIKLYKNAVPDVVLREARSLTQISSPYVVRCYAVDRLEDGSPYLVLEHVDGSDLSEILKKSKLTSREAIEIIVQIGEGLADVHAAGLLHRDIKPSNIVVDKSGVPKLIDFGLASPSLASPSPKGTPGYMAPECSSEQKGRIDQRTDVFGLGAVLYELLAGQPLFRGSTKDSINAKAQTRTFVTLDELRPDLPKEILRVCARSLEVDADNRPQKITDFVNELKASELYASRKQSRFMLWGLGGLVTCMALLFAFPAISSDMSDIGEENAAAAAFRSPKPVVGRLDRFQIHSLLSGNESENSEMLADFTEAVRQHPYQSQQLGDLADDFEFDIEFRPGFQTRKELSRAPRQPHGILRTSERQKWAAVEFAGIPSTTRIFPRPTISLTKDPISDCDITLNVRPAQCSYIGVYAASISFAPDDAPIIRTFREEHALYGPDFPLHLRLKVSSVTFDVELLYLVCSSEPLDAASAPSFESDLSQRVIMIDVSKKSYDE